jgi:hypothetical protein
MDSARALHASNWNAVLPAASRRTARIVRPFGKMSFAVAQPSLWHSDHDKKIQARQ